jgi:hypothetical protein
MENKTSDRDREITVRGLYLHLTDEGSQKDQLDQTVYPDAQVKFLEDKEHRWDRIFELLESEINSQ